MIPFSKITDVFGSFQDDVSSRSDTVNQNILAFADKVVGKKSYTKTIHFAKTMLQHEVRVDIFYNLLTDLTDTPVIYEFEVLIPL